MNRLKAHGFLLDDFTLGYIECALWSSTGDDSEPLDDKYGIDDISKEAIATMVEDCQQFQETHAELLSKGRSASYNGHDFWLTRNRHGVGFWDRGLGEVGDKLTEVAHAEGTADLYVGDDGRIYII